MSVAHTLTAVVSFALFGYLVVTTASPVMSFIATGISCLLVFPVFVACMRGPRLFLQSRARRHWLLAMLLLQSFYVAGAYFFRFDTSWYAILPAFILAVFFPVFASRFLPYQRLWDIAILLCIWLPFDHRITSQFWGWPNAQLGYPFASLLLVALTIWVFVGLRPGHKLAGRLPFRWHRHLIGPILAGFAVMAVILLPMAFATGFITSGSVPVWYQPLGLFTAIFFTVALPEELVFRGILQEILHERLHIIFAVVIAAALFGLTHWNNGLQWNDWRYVLLATIAGIGYGASYAFTRNLLAPIIIHSLVDTVWVTFFI